MQYTEDNQDEAAQDLPKGLPENLAASSDDQAFPTLELDHEKYRHHLADLDISDEQANEFLEVLWNIMNTMIEIGMGLDTVQMFFPSDAEKAMPDSGKSLKQKEGSTSFNEVVTQSRKDRK